MRCPCRVVVASLALAFASGCPREHDPDRVEVALEECTACHLDEFEAAADPVVHLDRLPEDLCATCHTTEAWIPSTYPHAPKVATCVACHDQDYQNTSSPVHPGMYSTTCDDCHGTTAWRPAGNHPESAFPITRGKHKEIACEDCHNVDLGPSTGGANADCTGCHEHRRSEMDDKHKEENGYTWSDTVHNFCLDCHPDGRSD